MLYGLSFQAVQRVAWHIYASVFLELREGCQSDVVEGPELLGVIVLLALVLIYAICSGSPGYKACTLLLYCRLSDYLQYPCMYPS